jgi:nucleoside-diphosphate-sugar epimerase
MANASGMNNYKIKGMKHGITLDLVGNCNKLKKLGFKHKYSIDDIIKDFS